MAAVQATSLEASRTKMTGRNTHRVLWLPLLAGLLLGGCDCENRIRKAISDPGRRTPGAADQADVSERGGTPGASQGSEPREVEPNDTRATATRQELSRDARPMIGSLSATEDQVDWFLVGAARDELVEIVATPQQRELDIELSIISSDDTPLIYDLEGAGAGEVVPYARIRAGEPLTLRVRRKSGEGEYLLEYRRHMSAGELEAEPNEIWSDALRLAGASTIQGFYDRPGDVDRFVLSASQRSYGVALSGADGLEQRLAIYLGDDLVWEGLLDKGRQQVSIPNLAPQREWRVEVSAPGEKSFSREKPYTLQVLEHGTLGAQEVLEVEPNDLPVTAGEVNYDKTLANPLKVIGYLHDANDVDVLRFPIDRGEGMMRMKLTDRRMEKGGEGKRSEGVLSMRVGQPVEGAPSHVMAPGEQILEHCELITPQMLAAGEFDVSVGLQSGASSRSSTRALFEMMKGGEDYTLEVWRDDSGVRKGAAQQGASSGSSMREAVLLDAWQEDAIEQSDHLLEPGAAKWYGFDVAPTQGADQLVTVSVDRHALDLMLELVDDEGGLVASMQASGKGGEERGELRLPSGRYFVKVTAREGASCDAFTLRLKR